MCPLHVVIVRNGSGVISAYTNALSFALLCPLLLCGVPGIPYCDYFIVQTRWVMTRLVVHNENRCMLQIGLDVVFRQNLLLKASRPSSIILCMNSRTRGSLAMALFPQYI
jgi:hypothetical protein